MGAESYRFQVGKFECIVVLDGIYPYPEPGHLFFSNAIPNELEKALAENGIDGTTWKVYESPHSALIVYTGKKVVLIDTEARKLAETTGRLMVNLAKEKIGPEDIDIVVITHAHGDHVGGLLNGAGDRHIPTRSTIFQKMNGISGYIINNLPRKSFFPSKSGYNSCPETKKLPTVSRCCRCLDIPRVSVL